MTEEEEGAGEGDALAKEIDGLAEAQLEAERPILGAAQIFGKKDTVYKRVPVPEWDGDVRVRSLRGRERAQFEAGIARRMVTTKDGEKTAPGELTETWREWVVSKACVDGNGQRIFSDTSVAKLAEKSGAALGRIADAVLELSGITKAEREEIRKNSETTTSEGG